MMPSRWRQTGRQQRQEKPKFQGRTPELPQAFYEGAAEFSTGDKQFRVESHASVLTLFSKNQEGEWQEEGSADSKARLVDLITQQTGKYHWSGTHSNLPKSVDTLLYGQEGEE